MELQFIRGVEKRGAIALTDVVHTVGVLFRFDTKVSAKDLLAATCVGNQAYGWLTTISTHTEARFFFRLSA